MVQALRGSSLEKRITHMNELMEKAAPEVRRLFEQRFEMSWIYHDGVMEGIVYTPEEFEEAFREPSDEYGSEGPDEEAVDQIRQYRATIALVRELAQRKRLTVGLDVIKRIYATLVPEEVEGRHPPRYRKEMPSQRMYFHELLPPEKISYRMRQLVQWMNAAETRRTTHPIRLAARAHHQLLHIYPFPVHSGSVARFVMNLLLLRSGYPPAIIHATERQRYYDALRTKADATAALVHEALVASVESTIRFFEEQDVRTA